MNILEKIENLISQGHRDAIKKIFTIIRSRSQLLFSRHIEFEAKRLTSKISSSKNKKVFLPIFAKKHTKLNTEEHNSNMESAYIDLFGLYTQIEFLEGLQIKQKDTLFDDYHKSRAAILKLINDTRVFALRNRLPQFDDIKLVDFNISSNRNDTKPSAVIDPNTRLLKLPVVLSRKNHLEHRGGKRTKLSAEVIGGSRGQLGSQFEIGKMTDSKNETFWAEAVYSDVPTVTSFNRWSPNELNEFVEEVNGPIAKISIDFGNAEPLNQIKIFPFANHPVKVLEITYKPTASSLIRKSIKDFTKQESLDWIEYNFETVFASNIEIILGQDNYRIITLHVPKHILYATDFFIRLKEERKKELSEIPDISSFVNTSDIYREAVKELQDIISIKELKKSPVTEIDLTGKTVLSVIEAFSVFSPELKTLAEDVSNYTNKLPSELLSKVETINKYEYIIGAREIECNYNVYSPIGYYSSEKFEPASTISNVELEVDEFHPTSLTEFGVINITSTEWNIELAEDRIVPIYPSNFVKDGYLKVSNERLFIDKDSKFGLSRFRSALNFVTVRQNNNLLTINKDYTLIWTSEEFDGKLKITIDDSIFDSNNIYTIDYFADSSAKSIDVSSLFNDKALTKPDIFNKTGPSNNISLSLYPYINYSIINSDSFIFLDESNAYSYIPPTGSYTSGFIEVHPNWIISDGTLMTGITGSTTILAKTGISGHLPNWNHLNSTYLSDPYRYYLKLTQLEGAIYEIDQIVNSGQIELVSIPELSTGLIGNQLNFTGNFVGNILTGGSPLTGFIKVPYSIDVIYKTNEQIFGFDNTTYKPITITVGGTEAKNITNYQSLEQPAFNVAETQDGEYEFIHDGKIIYFNQAITDTEIQASYRWLTKYIRVNGILRSNKLINPTATPVVDEFRLLINTTIL